MHQTAELQLVQRAICEGLESLVHGTGRNAGHNSCPVHRFYLTWMTSAPQYGLEILQPSRQRADGVVRRGAKYEAAQGITLTFTDHHIEARVGFAGFLGEYTGVGPRTRVRYRRLPG
jgi:hypothetical protein